MMGSWDLMMCMQAVPHIMQVCTLPIFQRPPTLSRPSFSGSAACLKMNGDELNPCVQARQHAMEAKLNDTLAATLQSQSAMASLILLPALGLLLAAASPPPLTMADLLLHAVLPANSVVVMLLAAAAACSVACLVISRGQDRR